MAMADINKHQTSGKKKKKKERKKTTIYSPIILSRSIDACSWMPIPFRMIRNEPSLKAPEQVTNC